MTKITAEMFRDPERDKRDAEFLKKMTEFLNDHTFAMNELGDVAVDPETLTMIPGQTIREETLDGFFYKKEWLGRTYYCNWF